MKSKFPALTLAVLLAAAGTTAALAHEDYSEGGSLHWLAHVAQAKSPARDAAAVPGAQGAGEENPHLSMDHAPSAAEKARKPAGGKAAEGAGEENRHMTMAH